MSLMPFDLTGLILADLQKGKYTDGLLHASSHLVAPLRHVQLELAGAPQIPRPFADEMTLQIGKQMHRYIEDLLRDQGLPVMAEVRVTPWLPKGWGGTADLVVWNHELQQFVLEDLKSTKGESIRWREERGASDEHRWQISMYWHALRKMGLPMARKIGVIYVPKNAVKGREVEPLFVEFEPIPFKQIASAAASRRKAVDAYTKSLPKPNPRPLEVEEYLTDELAPVPEREQKIVRVRGVPTLKLAPHWTAAYCPFPLELCDCRTHGTNTLGSFDDDGDFWPSKGHEDVEPLIWPEEAE